MTSHTGLQPAPFFQQLNSSQLTAKTHPPPEEGALPLIIIVGGSLGGACAAVALSSLGCQVQIFEAHTHLRSQGAGLVIQPDMAAFLEHYNIVKPEAVSVPSSGRQYVARDGSITSSNETSQLFSAWDVLYKAIKDKVVDPLVDTWYAGAEYRVVDVSKSTVTLASGKTHQAQLIVAADGAGSFIRSKLLPEVKSTYQGYVAWRGVVNESQVVPAHILDFLRLKFTVYQGPDFHILCYIIPGENGELEPGHRRVNWVWYWNTEDGAELERILTDKHGHIHGFSMPRGLLRDEIAEETKSRAREHLPSVLADLVACTPDIFLQAIHDMMSPTFTMSSDGGNSDKDVVLIGDAGCILRPHTAAGTTKAALNAWTLADSLASSGYNVNTALKVYEEKTQPLAQQLVSVGIAVGNQSQFSNSNKDWIASSK